MSLLRSGPCQSSISTPLLEPSSKSCHVSPFRPTIHLYTHLTYVETKNTWHKPDPSFTYLLCFFMLLTGIAWGIAYTSSIGATVRVTLLFVFVQFLFLSLVVATAAYFLVGRLLGPGIAGLPGRRRQQGLFTREGQEESLEFGYCFDVIYPRGLESYRADNSRWRSEPSYRYGRSST